MSACRRNGKTKLLLLAADARVPARKRKIDSTAKNVRKVADEESISDNMHDMLDTMSASLVDYEAEQCSIRFPDFTLKMKRNNDGDVVIEKTRTQKRIYL